MTRNECVELVNRADALKSAAVLEASLDQDKVNALCDAVEVFKAHVRVVYRNTNAVEVA